MHIISASQSSGDARWLPPHVQVASAFSCLVRFLYADASAACSSLPFAAATQAVVEVIAPCKAASFSLQSHRDATNGAHESRCGLSIRLISRTAGALPPSPSRSRVNGNVVTAAASSTVSAAAQPVGSSRDLRSGLSSSVVRAVRRLPRDDTHLSPSRLHKPLPATTAQPSTALSHHAGVDSPLWIPISAVLALDWHFCDGQQQQQQRIPALAESVMDADPHARSSTMRGTSVTASTVEVRLRCALPPLAASQPYGRVTDVVLSGLACSDALSLVDVYEAIKGTTATATSAIAPSNDSEAAAAAVTRSGHSWHVNDAAAAAAGALLLAQSTDAPQPSFAASASPVQPRQVSREMWNTNTTTSHGEWASRHADEAPLSIVSPTSNGAATEGTGVSAPLKHGGRSISFTSAAGQHEGVAGSRGQRQANAFPSSFSPSSGEASAYHRYAQLLGMPGAAGGAAAAPTALHGAHSSPLSPVAGLPSSASLADSFGSGLSSAVYTPISGTTLHFPPRDGASLLPSPPLADDATSAVSRDDPLQVPTESPLRMRGGDAAVLQQGERRTDAVTHDVRSTLNHRHHHASRYPHSPLTLPGVVDIAAGDTPQWFPAACAVSDVSEVTVSSTCGSPQPQQQQQQDRSLSPQSEASPLPTALRQEWRHRDAAAPLTAQGAAQPAPPPRQTNPPPLDEAALRATGGSDASSTILFPPHTTTAATGEEVALSPRNGPYRAEAKGSAMTTVDASPFPYLTPEQRQLVDFDRLLRPLLPPPLSPSSGSTAPSATAGGGAGGALRVHKQPEGLKETLYTESDALRPPAVLDQILMRLRVSALSPQDIAAEPAAAAVVSKGTADAAAVLPGSTASPAVHGNQQDEPLARATAAAPATTTPSTLRVSDVAETAASTPSNRLVVTYQEILQQMRDRRVSVGAAGNTLASPAAAAPPARSAAPTASATQSPPLVHAVAVRGAAAFTDQAVSGGLTSHESRATALLRTDAMPRRPHGPFAQPAQHPSNTFLALGGHRSPASPSSASSHRVRRLTQTLTTVGEPATGMAAEQQPAVMCAASPHLSSPRLAGHSSGSSTIDSSTAVESPSSSRLLRSRPGRVSRSPQTPPQMLPRRPEPHIGTPKLTLDQAGSADAALAPVSLGPSVLDEEAKGSATSMAT